MYNQCLLLKHITHLQIFANGYDLESPDWKKPYLIDEVREWEMEIQAQQDLKQAFAELRADAEKFCLYLPEADPPYERSTLKTWRSQLSKRQLLWIQFDRFEEDYCTLDMPLSVAGAKRTENELKTN